VPRNYWQNKSNHLIALKNLEKKLNIQQPADWYNFGLTDITKNGGSRLLNTYRGSLIQMLQTLYPQVTWEVTRFVM
jgi:hypothetical protein